MIQWLNVGVRGEADWPEEETKIQFGGHELVLRPATKNTEQSVHIALQGLSEVDALTLINRFLSILAWCDVSVARQPRLLGSSIGFPFCRDAENDPKTRLALALYREGRTINSIPFQFLSYFKILNIFWKDKFQNTKMRLLKVYEMCSQRYPMKKRANVLTTCKSNNPMLPLIYINRDDVPWPTLTLTQLSIPMIYPIYDGCLRTCG